MGQKHSIFVCRASGAFNSFITKIACSEAPSGFEPRYVTVSIFHTFVELICIIHYNCMTIFWRIFCVFKKS